MHNAILDGRQHENLLHLTTFTLRLETVLHDVLEANGLQCRHEGGYLALFDRIGGFPIGVVHVSRPPKGLEAGFIQAVLEEGRFLLRHPESEESFINRDNKRVEGAVAIRGSGLICAFAGSTSEVNEVFVTLASVSLGDVSFEQAERLLGSDRYKRYIPFVSPRQKVA